MEGPPVFGGRNHDSMVWGDDEKRVVVIRAPLEPGNKVPEPVIEVMEFVVVAVWPIAVRQVRAVNAMMRAGGVYADKEGLIALVLREHLLQALESEFITPRGISRPA